MYNFPKTEAPVSNKHRHVAMPMENAVNSDCESVRFLRAQEASLLFISLLKHLLN